MAERKTERRLEAKYPKTCVICGIDFMAKYSHSKACSAECSNALHYRQKEILNRANYGVYIKPGPVQKKQSYTSPISDAEQLALNRLIDSMNTYRPDQGRTISRGHPDFDRLVKEITPLDRIGNVAGISTPTFRALHEVCKR